MEFLSHQTANGITILGECNPQNQVAAFGIFVRAVRGTNRRRLAA